MGDTVAPGSADARPRRGPDRPGWSACAPTGRRSSQASRSPPAARSASPRRRRRLGARRELPAAVTAPADPFCRPPASTESPIGLCTEDLAITGMTSPLYVEAPDAPVTPPAATPRRPRRRSPAAATSPTTSPRSTRCCSRRAARRSPRPASASARTARRREGAARGREGARPSGDLGPARAALRRTGAPGRAVAHRRPRDDRHDAPGGGPRPGEAPHAGRPSGKMVAMKRRAIAAVLAAFLAAPAVAAAQDGYDATIRRTDHGIPHISADDFGGLGYGYGYAFAEDNLCVIADQYVTVRGERSKYFGPDETWSMRGNGTTQQQPQLGLLLQEDHPAADDREADGPAAAERPAARGQGGRPRLRRGLQPLPARGRRREPPRPGVPRRGVGQADRGDRRLPALLPARAARLERRRDRRHRRRAAADAAGVHRRRAARRARRDEQLAELEGPPAARRHRLERVRHRPRADRQRQGDAARQPALPVGRLRALLPVAPHDPRQDRRRRRQPVRRPGRAHRPHARAGLEPHGLDRVPLHAVRADARARLADDVPRRRPAEADDARPR